MFYPFHIPRIIQKLFPGYIFRVNTNKKVLYLTFDDGPTPEITEWVLNLLEKYKATATFFSVGKKIEKNPEIIKRIIEKKHQIGNHSYSHQSGWKTDIIPYVSDVIKTQNILDKIQNNSKKKPILFRPPYGKITRKQAKKLQNLGYKIILWEVISGDFDQSLYPEKSLKKTLQHTKSGSIVVFHDSRKAQKNLQYTLPRALEYWKAKGFEFRSLNKLLH